MHQRDNAVQPRPLRMNSSALHLRPKMEKEAVSTAVAGPEEIFCCLRIPAAGLEPATSAFGGRRSNPLSYAGKSGANFPIRGYKSQMTCPLPFRFLVRSASQRFASITRFAKRSPPALRRARRPGRAKRAARPPCRCARRESHSPSSSPPAPATAVQFPLCHPPQPAGG